MAFGAVPNLLNSPVAEKVDESQQGLAGLGPIGQFCTRIQRRLIEFCQRSTGTPEFDLPEPLTVAVDIDPMVVTAATDRFVAVETTGAHTAGMTVVDHLGVSGKPPNVRVIKTADRGRYPLLLAAECAQ